MKLSKTALWILGIGFFVIAAAALLMVYTSQGSDEEQIEDSLSVTQELLVRLTADKDELTSQLALLEDQRDEAELDFNQTKAEFPEDVSSIEYDEEIFLIADDCDLEVLSLTASEPRETKVEGENDEDVIIFTTTDFDVEVRGEVADILTFIDSLAKGGYFTTTTVDLISIEVPEPDEEGLPTAVIELVIYSYEGE